ncbi:LLM class flavin-dependent oxidoreductase [Bacillus sp. FJAT-42376]|uniref:LLM class flavin-dependent oxidoreductase n=1 Tax=Bacillus sp. FJAT-42376 TaxID=2014076 RepID=UPI000F510D98|nr:LLM class flavin-dependent oxidoreductase [Bacillus sp. FJAT-42376]AZB44858.1 LLM class flavin-dependent oxidoreductase [Bacillus sp. FJAT-42376]
MKLSILDQVPVSKNKRVSETLEQTAELAQMAESLGYTRYWFAEHHGTRGLASTSPEILISHIASKTKRIRVGSGGILLPQYSSYKVAENFRQLEALFPGRIDLGIGRSPGGTQKVRQALLDGFQRSLTEFPRQLNDLIYYITDTIPSDHPSHGIKAAPLTETAPAMWVLGLGENSAAQTGNLGLNYVFGHFIKPDRGEQAFRKYRESFTPVHFSKTAQSLAAVFVICGRSDEEAEKLALSQDLWLLRVEKGLDSRVPSMDEARAASLSASDKERIAANRKRMVIGGPDKVKKELTHLAERYETDEMMVLTNVYSFEDKKNSFKRLADLFL